MIILLVWFVGWFITAILLSRSLAEDGFGGKYTPNVTFIGGFGRR